MGQRCFGAADETLLTGARKLAELAKVELLGVQIEQPGGLAWSGLRALLILIQMGSATQSLATWVVSEPPEAQFQSSAEPRVRRRTIAASIGWPVSFLIIAEGWRGIDFKTSPPVSWMVAQVDASNIKSQGLCKRTTTFGNVARYVTCRELRV